LNQLAAGHVLIEAQLAGKIGRVAPGRDALAPAIMACDERFAGGWTQKSKQ
jgi:hypothetical protein